MSHTQVWRIERAEVAGVDLSELATIAEAVGHELGMAVHPVATPIRDAAHVALLGRLRARLHPSLRWQSEVPIPIPGDRRSGDARIDGRIGTTLVEAETRLDDIQAMERRIAAKARDLGVDRTILLVLDSRHNRAVIAKTPELRQRFPIGTRAALQALAHGIDLGGDALIVL